VHMYWLEHRAKHHEPLMHALGHHSYINYSYHIIVPLSKGLSIVDPILGGICLNSFAMLLFGYQSKEERWR
jgi:hypothetical protein